MPRAARHRLPRTSPSPACSSIAASRAAARTPRRCPRQAASPDRRAARARGARSAARCPRSADACEASIQFDRARLDRARGERRGRGDEAVEQHRHCTRARLHVITRYGGDLQTADLASQSTPSRVRSSAPALRPRSRRPRPCVRGRPRRCRSRDRRSRGGFAGEAQTRHAAAVVFPIPMSPAMSSVAPASMSARRARRRRRSHARLLPASSRASREVIRAGRTLAWTNSPLRESSRATPTSTTVSRAPVAAGEHVDRRAAAGDVHDHLRRHFARIGRYALRGDAVVGGEHRDRGRDQRPGIAAALARREPARQLLELAQRPGRFREHGLAGASRGERGGVGNGISRMARGF